MHITEHTVFYGPHPCGRAIVNSHLADASACTTLIVKSSKESGGLEFDCPSEPIYPNTIWHTHRCPALSST